MNLKPWRDKVENCGLFLEWDGSTWKIYDQGNEVHQLGVGDKSLRLTVNRLVQNACSCKEGEALYLKTALERRVS